MYKYICILGKGQGPHKVLHISFSIQGIKIKILRQVTETRLSEEQLVHPWTYEYGIFLSFL